MNSTTGEFRRILLASLVSQMGSHLLTLALAAYVFIETGSAVGSACVFVLSTFPAAVVSGRLGNWLDRTLDRKRLVAIELFSALVTLSCGLSIHFKLPVTITALILAARAILSFTSRTAVLKWIKVITPPDQIASRMQLYYLSFFASTVLSGILASILLSSGTLYLVVAVDLVTYGISAFLFLGLMHLPKSKYVAPEKMTQDMAGTIAEILKAPTLRASFLFVILSQCLFQGAYTCLVTFLPLRQFQIGSAGIGKFQIAASIGITLGFFIVWKTPAVLKLVSDRLTGLSVGLALGAILALGAVVSGNLEISLLSFFALNALFECIWLYHNSRFFRDAPANKLAQYQFCLSALAALLMAVVTLVYSLMIDSLGLRYSTLILASFGTVVFLAFMLVSKRDELEVNTEVA